ncbi:unnamed protein product [Eruca vesicaria subsp. sativa]|uniref:Uncharacterized protein n=1 Tax=Eruca vesicaria subsp. sativa TaxID=29727 RepID=A0ABC8K593_ERUVS|nr:unnamed protein product [Eruca vesicaria subsp. sativa]
MAMAMDMPPISMAEAGSSSFFNFPQQTSESQPLVTSDHAPEHISSHGSQFLNVLASNDVQSTIPTNQGIDQVPSLGNNFLSVPIFNPPQLTNKMQQPIITSNHGSVHVDALAIISSNLSTMELILKL